MERKALAFLGSRILAALNVTKLWNVPNMACFHLLELICTYDLKIGIAVTRMIKVYFAPGL